MSVCGTSPVDRGADAIRTPCSVAGSLPARRRAPAASGATHWPAYSPTRRAARVESRASSTRMIAPPSWLASRCARPYAVHDAPLGFRAGFDAILCERETRAGAIRLRHPARFPCRRTTQGRMRTRMNRPLVRQFRTGEPPDCTVTPHPRGGARHHTPHVGDGRSRSPKPQDCVDVRVR